MNKPLSDHLTEDDINRMWIEFTRLYEKLLIDGELSSADWGAYCWEDGFRQGQVSEREGL